MHLTLRLFARPREIVGRGELTLDITAGATVGTVVAELIVKYPDLEKWREYFVCSVNKEYATNDRRLEDGDELAIMPPVAGGAAPATGMEPDFVRLGASLMPLDAFLRQVTGRGEGAIVLFTGVARGENMGEHVEELEFEAYEGMVEAELHRRCAEARSKFGLTAVAVQHRTGMVLPGEDIVHVAAASLHREAAFEAARFLIEQIKDSVPIWKKEYTRTGDRWLGDATMRR